MILQFFMPVASLLVAICTATSFAPAGATAAESFEEATAGPLTSLATPLGRWYASTVHAEERPMRLMAVSVKQPVAPMLVRKAINRVLAMRLETRGSLEPLVLEKVLFTRAGTTRPEDVAEVSLLPGRPSPTDAFGEPFATAVGRRGSGSIELTGRLPLAAGDNRLWVSVRLPIAELIGAE